MNNLIFIYFLSNKVYHVNDITKVLYNSTLNTIVLNEVWQEINPVVYLMTNF